MAKVTGPLLSLDAKGNLKNVLNFSHGRDSHVVRMAKKSIAPPDPKTNIQLFNRSYWGNIVAIWHELSELDRESFILLSKSKPLTAFNLYIKTYQKEHPTDFGNTRFGISSFGTI